MVLPKGGHIVTGGPPLWSHFLAAAQAASLSLTVAAGPCTSSQKKTSELREDAGAAVDR